MEIVEEAEKLAEESPFIDLEAYKGQDDRQTKSLGTPGLFTPSHYILAHGKVTLDANFCICVTAAGWWAGNTRLNFVRPGSDLVGARAGLLRQPGPLR